MWLVLGMVFGPSGFQGDSKDWLEVKKVAQITGDILGTWRVVAESWV